MARSTDGFMSWIRRCKRKLIMGVLLAATPALAGCFGEFPLTRAVYRMNDRVDNMVVEQVVFWAFIILPVYGGAAFIDAVVFNLVEFWFDENVEFDVYRTPDGNTITVEPTENNDELIVTVSREDEVLERMHFVRVEDNHIEAYDMNGELVGKVLVGEDGSIRLADENGTVVRTISAASVSAMQS